MYCLALLDSGNYVLRLCRILEQKGYPVEVVSTPCKIAKDGCGYCLKFSEQYKDTIIREGNEAGIYVKKIYNIISMRYKNVYEKIYP